MTTWCFFFLFFLSEFSFIFYYNFNRTIHRTWWRARYSNVFIVKTLNATNKVKFFSMNRTTPTIHCHFTWALSSLIGKFTQRERERERRNWMKYESNERLLRKCSTLCCCCCCIFQWYFPLSLAMPLINCTTRTMWYTCGMNFLFCRHSNAASH